MNPAPTPPKTTRPHADATTQTRLPSIVCAHYRPQIMLPGYVGHTTRIGVLRSTLSASRTARSQTRTSEVSFSSLTRPCAKPRAHPLLDATWNRGLQRRSAKRKATIRLDDVPQGAIGSDALPPQDDAEPDYPPLLQQVRNNMLKFNHCVLVTRVGGFYEVL